MKWLDTKEYAAFCNAVRTAGANKIPKDGLMLFRNHLYRYTCNRRTHKIICVWQVKIEGNEDLIDKIIEEWEE